MWRSINHIADSAEINRQELLKFALQPENKIRYIIRTETPETTVLGTTHSLMLITGFRHRDTDVDDTSNKKVIALKGVVKDSVWHDALSEKLNHPFDILCVGESARSWRQKESRNLLSQTYVVYVVTPINFDLCVIAELVNDSAKFPESTLFYFMKTDIQSNGTVSLYREDVVKSFENIQKLLKENGAREFTSLIDIADFLNN